MLRPPPSSTLFPYTTLFRSKRVRHETAIGAGGASVASVAAEVANERLGGIEGASVLIVGADRKSTRLNSSHVRISYAVFCLKKKMDHRPPCRPAPAPPPQQL